MHSYAVLSRRRRAVACAVLAALSLLVAFSRPEQASSDMTPAPSTSFRFGGGGDFGTSSNATGVLRAIGGGDLDSSPRSGT